MLKKLNALGNIEVDKKQGYALISLNPELYPMDAVLSAAEKLIGKSYVILDGNPREEILVEIRPKAGQDIERLAFDFNKELVRCLKSAKNR